jgi:steroid delta-isomerase-like uncharacterized protein
MVLLEGLSVAVEANKAVVRRYLEEVWNQGHLAAIDELVAPTFVLHDNPYPDDAPGPAGVRSAYAQQSASFPDQHYAIEDIFAEGDKVAVRATYSFTHRVAVAGVSPTGQRIAVRDINLYRVVDRQIVEQWWAYDVDGMIRQLGVPADSEQAGAS